MILLVNDDGIASPGLRALSRASCVHAAFEALAVNEFAGADGFFFTSRIDPSARVAVTGDQVRPFTLVEPHHNRVS